MRNIETSIEKLRNATENGAEHFCFFLEDPIPYNPSYFYWYPSMSELCYALVDDLWAMLFESGDDEEIEDFVAEVKRIVDDLRLKKTPIFLEMTKRIQDVWEEYGNSSVFNFEYIGTYETLCKGSLIFERKIRNQFRYGKEEGESHKGHPIAEHEVDDFNEFISSEI